MRRRLAWSVACVVVLLAPPVHGSAVTSAVRPTPEGAASPTPAPVEPIGEVEPPAPEQPVVADAEIPEAEPPEAVAGAPAPAPAAAPSHAPWASFRDSLLEALPVRSVLIIGPLGLVLLIGGVVALVRRRHAAPEAEGVYGATAVPGGAAEETGVLIEGAAATEMPAAQTDDATETSAAAVSAAVEDEDTPAVQAAAMSEARAEREPEEDPLGRLTYYLAHRRYAHAEALVRGGIEQFPDRDEYRLKLLEVFDAAGDMSKYEEAARELEAAVGEDSPLMTMAARSRR